MTTIITDAEIESYEARIEGGRIISLSDPELQERIRARLRGDKEFIGDPFPWGRLTDDFRLRMGEMTVWAGYNGSGKSQLLGNIMAWLLPMKKVCIASMEMPLDMLAIRMYRQISGTNIPSPEYVEKINKKLEGRLFLYNVLGSITADRAFALARYCADELGINHLVIDSMVKCGTGADGETNARQTRLVNTLQSIIQQKNMHIHLVHHLRKGTSEGHLPNKFDLKGAGEIADLTDNLVLVWRNKPKEDAKGKSNYKDFEDRPDCVLSCVKQRHGECEPKVGLYFHTASLQYTVYDGRKLDWIENMDWYESE